MTDYYVDPSAGSNGNAGTSFGAAWATTQYALDNIAAGDEVRLCQSATETVTATVNVDTVVGTTANPIKFVSYNATGTTPQDGYTLQGVATFTGTALIDNNGGEHNYTWVGITFDANGQCNHVFDQTADTLNDWNWTRCTFIDGNAELVDLRNDIHKFAGCVFDGGTIGIRQNANRNTLEAIGCLFQNQSSHGVYLRNTRPSTITRCTFDQCGGDAINIETGKMDIVIAFNTIYNPTGDCIANSGTVSACAIYGNIFKGGVYGLDGNFDASLIDNNCYHGQSSGDADEESGNIGDDNVTSDPDFVDAAGGDFTLSSGSPCSGVAPNGGNLGAWGDESGGGGGGVSVTPFSLQNLQAGVLG